MTVATTAYESPCGVYVCQMSCKKFRELALRLALAIRCLYSYSFVLKHVHSCTFMQGRKRKHTNIKLINLEIGRKTERV